VLGIGCDRGTPEELVERGVAQLLAQALLSPASVKAVATVDLKADEPALLALCQKHGWALQTYPAALLDAVLVPTPSETVKRHVGTRGVAEPSALLAAGASELLVRKQIYTEPGAGRSMTFAVARIPHSPRKELVHG
jgi:cobalt-precorrin 5A hydrolase